MNSSNSADSVSLVLPVFNERENLAECLNSLRNLDSEGLSLEVITVDNGSTDGSLEIAQQLSDKSFQLLDVNVGAVRNFGVTKASGNIIAFLDADCVPPEDWLIQGLKRLNQNPNTVAGGFCTARKNPGWVERLWLLEDQHSGSTQQGLIGAAIIIRKDDFITIGKFDESITSGEDSEFSSRAQDAGFSVIIDKSLRVIHLGNPNTLGKFVKRQVWHAENYASKLKQSITDAVFILVIIFSLGLISALLVLVGVVKSLVFPLVLLSIPPVVLSAKRILRSGYKVSNIKDLLGILALDFSYLLGRSIGFVKGCFNFSSAR